MATGKKANPPLPFKSVVCRCNRFYLVFTGATDAGAMVVREKAGAVGAAFVDARETPFILCGCGHVLNFAGDSSGTVQ